MACTRFFCRPSTWLMICKGSKTSAVIGNITIVAIKFLWVAIVTKCEELPQMDVNVLIQTYYILTYKNEGLETTKGL